eukprot:6417128-Prorocentrum_lima.AAC.1
MAVPAMLAMSQATLAKPEIKLRGLVGCANVVQLCLYILPCAVHLLPRQQTPVIIYRNNLDIGAM